ncbi:helix-turn-helix domain-containing protein [Fodinicola acaciae]|uniref:helix-turn-helix domain-containing protein n=1 Tax=Fodinicola acaciae TaxID=2681555 RepID=UPI0013D6EF4F|nr:helix-turn-helix domain-containing protein [Fodinicola acaciae]
MSLDEWFDRIDLTSYAGGPLIHPPDPATEIVWRLAVDRPTAAFVRGPRTHASYFAGKEIPACLRLRFRRGAAAALFGVRADRLTNRTLPISVATDDPDVFLEHLERRLPSAPDVGLVELATDRLSAGQSVAATAAAVGVSERHLRDLFAETIGVSPKRYAGLSRLRAVLAADGSWSTRASEAGYYDQSHMAAHFRELMRVTPGAYAAGKLPTTAC